MFGDGFFSEIHSVIVKIVYICKQTNKGKLYDYNYYNHQNEKKKKETLTWGEKKGECRYRSSKQKHEGFCWT